MINYGTYYLKQVLHFCLLSASFYEISSRRMNRKKPKMPRVPRLEEWKWISLPHYSPVCHAKGQNNTYHPGDTQTTWDIAFTEPTTANVPLWWMAVLSISEGFASSANTMVACVPDLRKMVTEVNSTQLTDPTLKQELKQFELNCYIPARTAYLQDAERLTRLSGNLLSKFACTTTCTRISL
jgi:hypothetical protein